MYGEDTQVTTACEKGYAGALGCRLIQPTKRQQLQSRKDGLEAQLTKVNAALSALDEHPDLEKFLNTISQAEY